MSISLPISKFSAVPLPRVRPRTAIIASADASFRRRLSHRLNGLRWQVREAETGAQAWEEAEACTPEAVIVDSWLPDLDLMEFLREFRGSFPQADVLTGEGRNSGEGPRSPSGRNSSTRSTWRRTPTPRHGIQHAISTISLPYLSAPNRKSLPPGCIHR